jgi:hypothetical protein
MMWISDQIPKTLTKKWHLNSNLHLVRQEHQNKHNNTPPDDNNIKNIATYQLNEPLMKKWKRAIAGRKGLRGRMGDATATLGVAPKVVLLNNFKLNGKSFTTKDWHHGNSLVEFHLGSTQRFGEVEKISSSTTCGFTLSAQINGTVLCAPVHSLLRALCTPLLLSGTCCSSMAALTSRVPMSQICMLCAWRVSIFLPPCLKPLPNKPPDMNPIVFQLAPGSFYPTTWDQFKTPVRSLWLWTNTSLSLGGEVTSPGQLSNPLMYHRLNTAGLFPPLNQPHHPLVASSFMVNLDLLLGDDFPVDNKSWSAPISFLHFPFLVPSSPALDHVCYGWDV